MLQMVRVLALFVSVSMGLISGARAEDVPNAETKATASRSLTGPWIETGVGMGALTLAVPLTLFIAIAEGPPLLGCTGIGIAEETSPKDEEDECLRSERSQEREALLAGLAVGIPVALLGAALTAHGAYRIRRIRKARHAVATFEGVTLAAGSQSLYVGMSFRL